MDNIKVGRGLAIKVYGIIIAVLFVIITGLPFK